MINDKTELQRDISLISRAIGLFSAQPQKIANLFMQTLFDAARVDFGDRNLNKKLQSALSFSILSGAIMNAGVTLLYGILKHGYDEEDDYLTDFGYEVIRNTIGIFPSFPVEVINSVLSATDDKSWTSGVAENAVFENMNKLIAGMNAYHNSLNEELSDYQRNKEFNTSLYNGVDGLSKILGFPSVFASNISDYYKVDVNTGE